MNYVSLWILNINKIEIMMILKIIGQVKLKNLQNCHIIFQKMNFPHLMIQVKKLWKL